MTALFTITPLLLRADNPKNGLSCFYYNPSSPSDAATIFQRPWPTIPPINLRSEYISINLRSKSAIPTPSDSDQYKPAHWSTNATDLSTIRHTRQKGWHHHSQQDTHSLFFCINPHSKGLTHQIFASIQSIKQPIHSTAPKTSSPLLWQIIGPHARSFCQNPGNVALSWKRYHINQLWSKKIIYWIYKLRMPIFDRTVSNYA
jgi:hypothetical protein